MKEKSNQDFLSFKNRLVHAFSLRCHMAIILSGTALSGLALSMLMNALGVRNMMARYPLVVTLSYGVFFVLIKVWLEVIFPAHDEGRGNSYHYSNWGWNWFDWRSSSSSAGTTQGFQGGGKSGGGGASGSWLNGYL